MFFWIVERKIHKKKDHTTGYITYCVVFLFTPLEDVVQKLSLFSLIPNSGAVFLRGEMVREDVLILHENVQMLKSAFKKPPKMIYFFC